VDLSHQLNRGLKPEGWSHEGPSTVDRDPLDPFPTVVISGMRGASPSTSEIGCFRR
jgi:hypothetical protein